MSVVISPELKKYRLSGSGFNSLKAPPKIVIGKLTSLQKKSPGTYDKIDKARGVNSFLECEELTDQD